MKIILTILFSAKPGVSKHFEQRAVHRFFKPPQAKAKNIICEKQLINNCKRMKTFFFLEITTILGKKIRKYEIDSK